MSTDTIDLQLTEYETSYGEVEEEWKILSKEVGLCHKIEDTISLGFKVLGSIDKANDQWISDVRSGRQQFFWHKAAKIARRYSWWLSLTTLLLDCIEHCEELGYKVDGSAEFRNAFNRVSCMSLDVEAAKKASA